MKDTFLDANFPRTSDGRVYHLGLRSGEVANRILTVGSPSRAETISLLLDESASVKNSRCLFKLSSERGFLTITGHFNGTPVSIISIGMGYPNMDFFVHEVRECVDGEMVIVRLGSCGGLTEGLSVGSLVIPAGSVSIRRNYDYDFTEVSTSENANKNAYQISKTVMADAELSSILADRLINAPPPKPQLVIKTGSINASADSFYSSQGRQTSFPDHNETLIDDLIAQVPNVATLEMETFHLFHLAASWRPKLLQERESHGPVVPPTKLPVEPSIEASPSTTLPISPSANNKPGPKDGQVRGIRAAAVQMVFANRRTREFISPDVVRDLEAWSGRVVLEALCSVPL